jgi:hypothetical protein
MIMTTEEREVMSLQDLETGLRPGQVWIWKSSQQNLERVYLLCRSLPGNEDMWYAIDLESGKPVWIHTEATQFSPNWKRHA